MRESVENLVIGGGLAGSMVALRLASAGREVLLLEKEREAHHKVCGEFLSGEAIEYLQGVGINPSGLGAQTIQRVRVHSGGRTREAPLPFAALSLSRFVLDEALLQTAESRGCEVRPGTAVSRLQREGRGWRVQLRSGESINAGAVFLATGKHDVNESKRGKGLHNGLVGFKMHWELAARETHSLQGVMELFLFHGGYGGLLLVEDGIANLCLVVRKAMLRELGGWPELVDQIRHEVPAIDRKLSEGTMCWAKPLAISSIPYGYLAQRADGLWRVGDQAAVIPSFTGDGMAIALHSACLAAEMYLAGKSPGDHLLALRRQLRMRMYFATALSRVMVTGVGRLVAPGALSPGLTRWIAEATRIPAGALSGMRTA